MDGHRSGRPFGNEESIKLTVRLSESRQSFNRLLQVVRGGLSAQFHPIGKDRPLSRMAAQFELDSKHVTVTL